MATFIKRNKKGRIISRTKFKPGTSSSPFRKKSSSSKSKTRKATAAERKVAEDIARAFAPALKKASRSSGRRRQTAAEVSRFTVKIVDPRTKKVTQQIDKRIESSSLRRSSSGRAREAQRKVQAKALEEARQKIFKPTLKPKAITPKPFKELDKTTQALLKGKSIPITSQTLAIKNLNERNKAIEKEQIRLLKNLPKDVVMGVFEVGKEVVGTAKSAVLGSVNYGRNLVKRSVAAGGGKRPIDFLISDVKKIGATTVAVTKLVKNNPQKALVIVGAASKTIGKSLANEFVKNPVKTTTKAILILAPGKVIKGVGKGVQAISKSKIAQSVLHAQKFSANKFTVNSNLVTGISKIKGKTSGKFLNGKKFTTQYRLTVNPKTKKVTGQLVTKTSKRTITQNVNLLEKPGFYIDPKTKVKVPKLRVPIKSRSIKISETQLTPIKGSNKVRIAADGSFVQKTDADFITTVTRIIDNTKKVSQRTGQIRILTSSKTKRIKNLSEQLTKVVGKKKRTLASKPLTKSEIKALEDFVEQIGVKNLSGLDRRTKVAQALGIKKTSPTLKGFEDLFKSRFAKVKVIPKSRITNVKKLISSKTKSLARLKNKSSRKGIILKSEIKSLNKKLITLTESRTASIKRVGRIVDTKTKIIRKGKAVVKGEIVKKAPVKRKIKFKIKTRKLSDLRKSKKGQVSFLENDRIQVLRRQGTKFVTQRSIKIPALQSSVPLTIPVLRGLGVLTRATTLLTRLSVLQRTGQALSQAEFTKQAQAVVQGVREIQKVIDKTTQRQTELRKQKLAETQKQVQAPTQKQIQTTKTTRRTTPRIDKKITVPRISPKPPVIPIKLPRVPSFDLSFATKLPKGQRLSFGIKFRERKNPNKPFNKRTNPVITKTRKLGLPFNAAIKRGFGGIDQTTQRSAQLFIQGITKAKDIGKQESLMKKFTIKKGKKTLRFVEKSKFAIDKKGEKKGLSLSKALKPKPKKKPKKVSKSSNKKKRK